MCYIVPSNRIQILVTGSESIIEIINALNPELHNLNIKQLLPYLYQITNGLTMDEKQNLQLTGVTDYSKIQYLLLKLQSKNEETLLDFVKAIYKSCQQGGNGKHCEIIKLFQARGIVINELTSEQ